MFKYCSAFVSDSSPASIREMWLEDKSKTTRLWRPANMPGRIQFSSRLLPDKFNICSLFKPVNTSKDIVPNVLLASCIEVNFGVEVNILGGKAAN